MNPRHLLLLLLAAPGAAQENAYPLQLAEGRTAHRPEVPGVHGLVTAGHPLAATSGLQILMRGGNAADAAVATLATLNVVRPQMSGAAGNGFLTYFDRESGQVLSLNAAGAAPAALDASALEPEQLNKGIHAGVVPGLFGGWIALLERFGTMTLAEVLAPAIGYARDGHPLEASVAQAIRLSEDDFAGFPTSMRMFLPEGRLPETGELFRMPDLARTFQRLVDAETDARRAGRSREDALRTAFDRFYRGDIAREMARFYEDHGGAFTMEDFAGYQPRWTDAIHANYRGYDVFTSPPTSRGGLEVLMQLKLVEGFDLAALGHNSPEALHLIVEAIKLAKADIYRWVADPSRFAVPVEGMVADAYAASRRTLIDRGQASSYPDAGAPPGAEPTDAALAPGEYPLAAFAGSTTSFSIVDATGNALACTPTHGGMFGTAVVVGSTGLTFNNGTRIGSTAPDPAHRNYARGGQIPILNNSPIVVLRDGRFLLALGTPGGETIGQTQFQVLLNLLDFGMGIQAAVAAPRLSLFAEPNFYTPGADMVVRIENRVASGTRDALAALGHRAELAPGYALGSNNGILVNLRTGTMTAGADPRRAAYAIGY